MVQHTLRDIRVILTPFRFVSLSTHEKTFMIQGRLMVPVNTKEPQESGGRNNAPARIGTHIDR